MLSPLVKTYNQVLLKFLPETADEKLPNSLEEGERFGRDQSFFLVPFMAKYKERRTTANGDGKQREDHINGSTLTMETNLY